jgi:hypothetical protein
MAIFLREAKDLSVLQKVKRGRAVQSGGKVSQSFGSIEANRMRSNMASRTAFSCAEDRESGIPSSW